jgi:hypothetical protein
MFAKFNGLSNNDGQGELVGLQFLLDNAPAVPARENNINI